MIPQEPGRPVRQSQGWQTMIFLQTVGRLSASEGSLSVTVEINLDAERTRRGGKVRGEKERVGKGGGGGYGRLLEDGGGLIWKTHIAGTTAT